MRVNGCSGASQKLSWLNRANKSGGSTLARGRHSTLLRTACSPGEPNAASNASASYETLSKSCGNGGSSSSL